MSIFKSCISTVGSCSSWAWSKVSSARNGFSVAQTVSMAAGVIGSVGTSVGGVIAGAAMGLVQGVNADCFQGPEIDAADQEQVNLSAAPASSYGTLPEAKEEGCGNVKCSYATQFLYTGFDAAKSGFNRYFILATILKSLTASNYFFWGYYGVSMLIKQIFNMTNETYATTTEIAQRCQGENASSCFKSLFCCTGETSIKVVRKLGSLDHTVNDDVLPLIALIPSALLTNPIFLGVASPVVLALIYAVYKQTDLFEGTKCEENLRGGKKLDLPEMNPRFKSLICFVLKYLMGPLHGAADGVPVYLKLHDWSLVLGIIIASLTTLASARGIQKSEVRKALEQLSANNVDKGYVDASQVGVAPERGSVNSMTGP